MYDSANLKKLKAMKELAPEPMAAFDALNAAVFKDGALSVKMKELIAVAVAVTTQCPYCIDVHVKKAKGAGASDAELTEATMVAAALRAGGAVTHGTHAIG
jgi:AhpD family alkylhydroperoxidase